MRDKAVFGGASVAVSLVLYAAAMWAQSKGIYVPSSAGFLVAALAVIACALGVTWGRKAAFGAALLTLFVGFDVMLSATGLRDSASGAGSFSPHVPPSAALFLAAVPLVLPLAAVAALVGGDPGVLWMPKPATRRKRRKVR